METVDRSRFEALRKEGRPVVVDFYADWCAPCHALAPELEKLHERHGDDVAFVKLDVDADPDVAQRFGVRGIPTVVRFDGDDEVARSVGAVPAAELAKRLELESVAKSA